LAAGPIKLKDVYAVYPYDNTLYVIEATGQMVKDELEWSAGYFDQYYFEPDGVTKDADARDYNYDMWSGIEYRLDVTKPASQRVVDLKLNGRPLAMDQHIRVATTNYRATGRFSTATMLCQSTTQVRDLITQWITARGTISPSDVFVQNWALLPPADIWLNPAVNITRPDYADLLWTAFYGMRNDYLRVAGDAERPGTDLSREASFFLLSNKAMKSLREVEVDMAVLDPFTDRMDLSPWAKGAVAFAIQTGIFVPSGNLILPQQLATNGEALAWVREARYPR
jgi:2',3'-cyclic-nucleotide 2'-phosphodiesterase/3'-nucleotidase